MVDLGEVDTGAYGAARITAVVGFAGDAVVVDGELLTFEGTVGALDHFARRLVVTDAMAVSS